MSISYILFQQSRYKRQRLPVFSFAMVTDYILNGYVREEKLLFVFKTNLYCSIWYLKPKKYDYYIDLIFKRQVCIHLSYIHLCSCHEGQVTYWVVLEQIILLNTVVIYLRNIKHFPCWYTVISTRVEIGKTRNYVETRRPQGGVFSHNFEFFQFSRVLYFFYNIAQRTLTEEWREIFRVDIELYQHGS